MKYKRELPSQAFLKLQFVYEPDTGIFRSRIKVGGGKPAGSILGSDNGNGYFQLWILGKFWPSHRVAWKWMTGVDPLEFDVHHRNHNRSDNRWSNLMLLDPVTNASIQCWGKRRAKSGFRGVKRLSPTCFSASMSINKKDVHLGCFKTPEEAALAYDKKSIERWGSEAPLNFPMNGSV